MNTFYIVRHGETENNRAGRLSGWADTPLTANGLEPTKVVIAKLQQQKKIDVMYASDLGRASTTADAIKKAIGHPTGITLLADLREVSYGDAAHMLSHEAYALYPGLDSETHYVPPNGESLDQMQRRVLDTVVGLDAAHTDMVILLVAHSGVMAALNASYQKKDFGEHNISEAYSHDYVGKFMIEDAKVALFEGVELMDETTTYTKINELLKYAGLGQASTIRSLGSGVHNDGYYAKVGPHEYCVRVARYEGKRGLIREADALKRLPKGIAPELIHFSENTAPIDRLWSITTFIGGVSPKSLTLSQLESLGSKLAHIHAIAAPGHDVVDAGEVTGDKSDLWKYLLWSCRSFYDSDEAMPDDRLARFIPKLKQWFDAQQKTLRLPKTKYLLHKDVGVGNLIAKGDEVFVIDWEDREFGDPMSDFPTGFWDIEAAGRIVLSLQERQALYRGYIAGGGAIDEDRIQMWMTFDKMVVALFFANRIYKPKKDATPEQVAEYRRELDKIITTLKLD